jgi:hypothetical protein
MAHGALGMTRRTMTSGDESQGATLMHDAGVRLVTGVEATAPGWVERTVRIVVDAWGRLDAEARTRVFGEAERAGRAATDRVVGELRALFALDAAAQRTTPLEIVRSLRREVTTVLAGAGVPPIERDAFDERAFPDDAYGVVPKSLADLAPPGADDDLGPLLLAWGLGKSKVLRARAVRHDLDEA